MRRLTYAVRDLSMQHWTYESQHVLLKMNLKINITKLINKQKDVLKRRVTEHCLTRVSFVGIECFLANKGKLV